MADVRKPTGHVRNGPAVPGEVMPPEEAAFAVRPRRDVREGIEAFHLLAQRGDVVAFVYRLIGYGMAVS
ncbi:MAG: hypothetical protein AAF919_12765 [Pseudomonadota bacterium]